ncbi:MAG: ribonuclease HII [Deinococcota bacterium]|nr:ribonuclease HII [Deinococcota bacterium]
MASTVASTAAPSKPGWTLEQALWTRGYSPVAGVDEAGRGALAGPVVAAAVVLPYGEHPFDDSKRLTAARRERLADEVKAQALAWAVALATAREVDRFNVLGATHLAAGRALAALGGEGADDVLACGPIALEPAALVTDYLRLDFGGPVSAPPRADGLSLSVAAASILAKTERDRLMLGLGAVYPGYGFASNKGYGSSVHLQGLTDYGPCPEHRLTYRPVAQRRLV